MVRCRQRYNTKSEGSKPAVYYKPYKTQWIREDDYFKIKDYALKEKLSISKCISAAINFFLEDKIKVTSG